MDRRYFIKSSALGLSGLFLGTHAKSLRAESSRPNIILIMADDLGYECLSSYGSASYRTPTLDALADEGVRFEHCYSQPLCTPSRIKIMTGKYNFRNYTTFGALHPDEKTFGHLFRDAGYDTCIVGKWQLAARGGGKGSYPIEAGFDDYCLWQIDERDSRFADPLLKMKDSPLKRYEGEYGPDIYVDYANRFIEQHQDKPFFIYFPMALTHDPFVPTPDSPEWDKDPHQQDDRFFKDMVEYMDKLVGRMVYKLEQEGVRENTLILFTGDNGTHWNIKSKMSDGRVIQGAKGEPTDAGTRVPLIANWPAKIQSGAVLNDLVEFCDFLPTMADAAGISPDTYKTDGVSFLPQMVGEKANPREWVLIDYPGKGDRWESSIFVREHRWKLYSDGQLFDIENDVLEQQPIQRGDSEKADLARARLQAVLDYYKPSF